jgi:hypothetical protein
MSALRRLALLAAALLTGVRPAGAQDSQFGIRGLGTPGRWESVRARTTGGAFTAFDAASALADAALADVHVLSASAVGAMSYRSVSSSHGNANLRSARFPLFTVATPISGRLVVGGGFSTYLDQSYDVVTRDSVLLRGAMVPFADEVASDGGISDMRVAAAARLGPHLALGLGFHTMTGSARLTELRRFADTTVYATVRDSQFLRQTGFGVSASAMVNLPPIMSFVGYARLDGHFNTKIDDLSAGETGLPNMLGGAARLTLSPLARAAASIEWRSWSNSGPDAYNTINWSAGLELGRPGNGVRLGGRGGHLPFGPGGSAPSEWGLAGGFGRTFSGGHGILDLGIERLVRNGGGLHEGVWTLLLGLTIRQ